MPVQLVIAKGAEKRFPFFNHFFNKHWSYANRELEVGEFEAPSIIIMYCMQLILKFCHHIKLQIPSSDIFKDLVLTKLYTHIQTNTKPTTFILKLQLRKWRPLMNINYHVTFVSLHSDWLEGMRPTSVVTVGLRKVHWVFRWFMFDLSGDDVIFKCAVNALDCPRAKLNRLDLYQLWCYKRKST